MRNMNWFFVRKFLILLILLNLHRERCLGIRVCVDLDCVWTWICIYLHRRTFDRILVNLSVTLPLYKYDDKNKAASPFSDNV